MTQNVQTVPALLLVEPGSLLRGTVASAARHLRLANVQEATSVRAAERLLELHRFEMLMLALDGDGLALQLLSDLRVARFASHGDLIDRLKSMRVRKIVLKPSKARTLLDAIADLGSAMNELPRVFKGSSKGRSLPT